MKKDFVDVAESALVELQLAAISDAVISVLVMGVILGGSIILAQRYLK